MEFREPTGSAQPPHQSRESPDCRPSAACSNPGNGRGRRSRRSSRRRLKVSFVSGLGRVGQPGVRLSPHIPVICFLKFIQLLAAQWLGVTAQCLIVSRTPDGSSVTPSVSGLERKISMRTSKEELIQRGILLPGDPGIRQDSRAASPRLNLPQLVLVNKSGKKSTPVE